MNILNVGRCSRCLASEIKTVIKDDKIRKYRYCNVFKKYCRGCSSHCTESPMGINSVSLDKIKFK